MASVDYQVDEKGKRVYPERTCAYKPCGRVFRPDREWQIFHTRRCAAAARYERYKERHQPIGDTKVEDVRCKHRHKGVKIKSGP